MWGATRVLLSHDCDTTAVLDCDTSAALDWDTTAALDCDTTAVLDCGTAALRLSPDCGTVAVPLGKLGGLITTTATLRTTSIKNEFIFYLPIMRYSKLM